MDKLDENKNYSEAIKNILKEMDKRNLDSVDNIENEVKKLVDKEKEIIKERNIDPVNPDDLYYLILYKSEWLKEIFAKKLIPNYESFDYEKQISAYVFYGEYHRVAFYLRGFIRSVDGRNASHEKCEWLLKNYLKYLLNDELEEIDNENEERPNCGTAKEWNDFIEAYICSRLMYTDDLFDKREILLEEYSKYSKHSKHLENRETSDNSKLSEIYK